MDSTRNVTTAGGADETPKFVVSHPVVFRAGKDRKRQGNRTSSRGSQRLTEIDQRASKAARRLARATFRGIKMYIKRRDESKAERRDGAVVDFVENVSYGASKTIAVAAPVLHDIGEALNTRRLRSQIRRFARGFGRLPLIG